MTHKDIFTKFMIEYDKANVTSSYPSLTEYEIATVLDKAYMALISQKLTGNNVRRSPFEADTKSVADLQPLVTTERIKFGEGVVNDRKGLNQFPVTNQFYEKTTDEEYWRKVKSEIGWDKIGRPTEKEYISTSARSIPDNVRELKLPEQMLYYVAGAVPVDIRLFQGWMNDKDYTYSEVTAKRKIDGANVTDYREQLIPLDNKLRDYYRWDNNKIGQAKHYRMVPVKLVSHNIAEKFFATAYNIPWVKIPVAYLENGYLFVVVDPIVGIAELPYTESGTKDAGASVEDGDCEEWMSLTYIRKPNLFVKTGDLLEGDSFSEPAENSSDEHKELWEFELNDVAAEELISLAVSYALENVESPRLNAHLGMRGLES